MTSAGSVQFWFAGVFVLAASLISIHGIWQHLRHYRRPNVQRSTIRILWMPVIYGLTSCWSFGQPEAALFLDPVRDCYEAFVIWVFFQLLIHYLGGERALMVRLDDGRLPTRHPFPMNYILQLSDFSQPREFLALKRGILQFVLVKPVHALIIIVLRLSGVYDEGEISWSNAYVYLSLMYNVSVMISLYSLALLYMTTANDLKPYNPLAKFACVKAVIFLTFWQSLVISVMVNLGVISSGNDAVDNHDDSPHAVSSSASAIQHWLICFEMMVAAYAHHFAFTYREFSALNSARLPMAMAVRDAFGVKDLWSEIQHTWTGTNFLTSADLLSGYGRGGGVGGGGGYMPVATGIGHQPVYVPVSPNVHFSDLSDNEDDETEQLYREAAQLPGGDYGYSVKA